MTIKPDQPWGRAVPRPDDLVVVDDDAALAAALAGPDRPTSPVTVRTGDLARTLGIDAAAPGSVARVGSMNELPVDLVEVHLDERPDAYYACAHVVARSTGLRGSWFRGRVLLVMNAEFHGDWDVAPRSHPNDGRVEIFDVDPAMTIRQRLTAARRARTGRHVPHPAISTRSIRAATWVFDHPLMVEIDGVAVDVASTITVRVIPDAGLVHA